MTPYLGGVLRLLLVERHTRDVTVVRTYLDDEQLGPVEITEASSLAAAREELLSRPFDLVLLDLDLPDGRGVEVVSRVREILDDVPIVVLADEAQDGEEIEAVRLDAQDYLLKEHLTPSALARSIRHAVERHRWRDSYRHQLNMSPDGVIVVEAAGEVLFANQAAVDVLGSPKDRLADVVMRHLLPERDPIGVAELDTGRTVEVRSAETDWHGRTASLITLRDVTDRVVAEAQLRAVTDELRRSNERLEEMVTSDPLTNVLNRRGIDRALHLEIERAKRSGDKLTAVLIDMDDFKSINDSHGLVVGDAALGALCRSVLATVRSVDHFGRVGGDEFIVLLPGTSVAEGIQVAEKLRRAIRATSLPLVAERISLTASFAVGPIAGDVAALDEVLTLLHAALRNSKRAGKDRICSVGEAGEGTELRLVDASLLGSDISLDVVFHGIRELVDESVVGIEALTRGPPGEFSNPGDLFRAAFEQDMLTAVDLRALRASLERFKTTPWAGWYHVNVFPTTLIDTAPEHLASLLQDAGIDERVCIELSEQQFLGDPTYLRRPIETLRKCGFRVAIDDVGFGRSSIEALMVLEPDVVKIDRKCLHTVGGDAAERRQLERLIAMLRAVQATVIVEGVETRDELELVRDMGVQYAQGYLWGKPSTWVRLDHAAERPA
ncbi:MAG: EAL domain-containing protein [Gemmatimonadales bacterium]